MGGSKAKSTFWLCTKKKNCSVHTSLNILYAYINGAKAKSTFGYALKKIVVFTLV